MFKTFTAAIILATVTLTGCTSAKLTKLDSDISTLNDKVEVLAKDVKEMQDDVKVARYDADRANKRLDNQATTYTK